MKAPEKEPVESTTTPVTIGAAMPSRFATKFTIPPSVPAYPSGAISATMLDPAGTEIASPAAPTDRNTSATVTDSAYAAPVTDIEASRLRTRTTRRTRDGSPDRSSHRSIRTPQTTNCAMTAASHQKLPVRTA